MKKGCGVLIISCQFPALQQVWERFISAEQLPNEPLLYQHITDKALELLLKTKLPSADLTTPEDSKDDLTFEEQNAVQYIGYVIHSLHQKTKDSGMKHVLHELKDEENTNGPAQEWVNTIDRDGLTKITTEAYRFFMLLKCVFNDTTPSITLIKWMQVSKQN